MDKVTVRVLVVDDHPVVRDGLASMLETQDDIGANVLSEHGIDPAPERGNHTSWPTFLKAH